MPKLFIHAINAEFDHRDSGAAYDTPAQALAVAISGAAAMAGDEINAGASTAAIVVSIEEQDGTSLLRSVVTLSVSPLLAKAAPGPLFAV